MDNPNILTGLPPENMERARLEIDEFCLDNEMLNLFLIALEKLQQESVTEIDGKPNWVNFYGIASIHGLPQELWNAIDNPLGGNRYCHHSRNTFPTWHRPYMFLFELAVYNGMRKLADEYEGAERDVYRKAAARFRLPYWDIVMPRYKQTQDRRDTQWGFPKILKAPRVTVRKPHPSSQAKDGWESIHNPLYSFVFPTKTEFGRTQRKPIDYGAETRFYNTLETCRIAKLDQTGRIVTNVDVIDVAIQRQAAARSIMMWQMLNPDITAGDLGETDADLRSEKIIKHRTWAQFANREERGAGKENIIEVNTKSLVMPSIEAWHDGIHVLMGTGTWWPGRNSEKFAEDTKVKLPDLKRGEEPRKGHMGDPAFAAFDPLFFLHHCNIDRLLAIFQAVNPKLYCEGADLDANLAPFIKSQASNSSPVLWRSKDAYIKDYWNAGFAVPGDKDLSKADQEKVRSAISAYFSRTYGWATDGVSKTESKALRDWPKDLTDVWALQDLEQGLPRISITRPVLEMTGLRLNSEGVPELFTRKVTIGEEAAAKAVVKDLIVEPEAVLAGSHRVDALLPKGAFAEPLAKNLPAVQTTWNARVKVRKYAFNGSFSVHLFIGYVKDEQPERFMTKKNEVGFTGVFASTAEAAASCANCVAQRNEDLVVEDVIPITTTLYDYLEATPNSELLIPQGDAKTILDLSPEHVVPFLKANLKWRMIDLNATLLAGWDETNGKEEQQAGLEITISSRPFTRPTAENLMGVYGPETIHAEITSGTPGGFGYVYPAAA